MVMRQRLPRRRMKQTLLSRYEQTEDSRIIIDVAANQVEDLYNNYDKNAPYVRRDLDRDLVDYLIECAREIKNSAFVIRFTLTNFPDSGRQARVRRSVNAYFLYLEESERQQGLAMLRKVGILFFLGLAILFLSVSVHRSLGAEPTVLSNVIAEGLTIAAWVSLWESLATLLLEWIPQHHSLHIYQGLASSNLIFRQEPGVAKDVVEPANQAGEDAPLPFEQTDNSAH